MTMNDNVKKLYRERAYYVRKQYEIDRKLGHWVEYGELPPEHWLFSLLERVVGAFVDAVLARVDKYRKH